MRTFKPWKGNEYECNGLFGVKILILGKYHYGRDNEQNIFTGKVVKDVMSGIRKRFFTITQRMVTLDKKGAKISPKNREAFWNKVAFCNYIQDYVGEKYDSKKSPTEKMWNNAKEPFIQTIEELQPDVLIVLGVGLGKNLLKNLEKTYINMKIATVTSPARSMSYDDSRSIIRCALATAGVPEAVLDANRLSSSS